MGYISKADRIPVATVVNLQRHMIEVVKATAKDHLRLEPGHLGQDPPPRPPRGDLEGNDPGSQRDEDMDHDNDRDHGGDDDDGNSDGPDGDQPVRNVKRRRIGIALPGQSCSSSSGVHVTSSSHSSHMDSVILPEPADRVVYDSSGNAVRTIVRGRRSLPGHDYYRMLLRCTVCNFIANASHEKGFVETHVACTRKISKHRMILTDAEKEILASLHGPAETHAQKKKRALAAATMFLDEWFEPSA